MQMKYITLKNFLGWRKLSLDLTDYKGVILLTGVNQNDFESSNGVGKSSLIRAITFAIFGELPGINMDDLIHQGEDSLSVSLEFNYDNKDYEIIRTRKLKGKKTLSFKCLTDKTKINISPDEFLNINMDTWLQTNYSQQGDLAGFLKYPPYKRKEILHSLFRLDQFHSWYETSKKTLNSITTKILELKTSKEQLERNRPLPILFEEQKYIDAMKQYDYITQEIQNQEKIIENLTGLENKKQLIEKDIHSLTRELQSLSYDFEKEILTTIQMIDTEIKNIQSNKSKEEQLKKDMQDLSTVVKLEGQLKQSLENEKNNLSKLQGEIYSYEREVKTTEKTLKDFEKVGAVCSVCKQKVDESHKQLEINKLVKTIDDLNNYIKELKIKEATLLSVVDKLNKDVSLNEQAKIVMTKLSMELGKIQESNSKLSKIEQDKIHLEQMLKNKQIEVQGKKQEIELALNNRQKELQEIIPQLSIFKSEKEKLNILKSESKKIDEIKNYMSMQKARFEEVNKIINNTDIQIQRIEEDSKDIIKQEQLYTEITKSLHANGIPSLILANWLDELQNLINEYLNFLADNKINIKFSMQKNNASNSNVADTLDIIVADENGVRSIDLYSGGEKTRIYLAVRLALVKLLALKGLNKLNILIIDEISDLDQSGMKSFLEILKTLEEHFPQIFFVTHITDLTNEIKNNIILKKDLTNEQI